jgi:3-oxoacyl-[acyl-carrier protein] reductase
MAATNGTIASNGVSASSGPLKGKVALVTGAGRGIGAGIAKELAIKGASVVVNYANSSGPASGLVKEIEAIGSKAVAIKADVTKLEEIETLFEKAVEHFGRLDIVASNSGKEKFQPLAKTTLEDFNEIFDINTRAQFFVAKAAHKHLSPGGRLVLMSSIAAGIGVPGHSLYAGSKSAVEGFTRCFAGDFGEKGCTVNCIAPAGVKSDMWSQNSWRYAPGCDKSSSIEQIEEALANGSPLKRCAVPADIGRVVAFLASPDGEWINGKHSLCALTRTSTNRRSRPGHPTQRWCACVMWMVFGCDSPELGYLNALVSFFSLFVRVSSGYRIGLGWKFSINELALPLPIPLSIVLVCFPQ